MADVMRRVITLFDVQGEQRVRASLGMMAGGFDKAGQAMQRNTRQAGLLDSQLRALGTTIRYALSGFAVFGTLQMVRNLGEFESKLGDIAAIATGPGGLAVTGKQLDNLGQSLIDVSNKTAQPISDLQEGVLSLYSTIGDVPPDKASKLIETISKTAVTSQSNIQDTTQALLGMMNAFGEGTDSVAKFGDEFQMVIKKSAGMPGTIYAQKLGVISSAATISKFTPEQMGALAIGATRFGGAPATNMQYLAQFMQSLMHPITKAEKAQMSAIGLGEQQRKRMTGWEVLQAFMAAVNRAGGVSGVTRQSIGQIDQTLTQDDQSLASLGIGGITGGGADIINKAFGRLQSKRMATVLSRLITPGQVKGTENETLTGYLSDVEKSAGSVDAAMERAMERKRIVQAGNAIHNLGIELGVALNPLINPVAAHGIIPAVEAFSSQNEWLKRGEIAGGALGAFGLVRFLKNRGRGVPGIGRSVGMVGAGADVLTESERGSTPLKPLYVVVVYSMAGGIGLPGLGRGRSPIPSGPAADMRTAENEAANLGRGAEGAAAKAAARSRFGNLLRRGSGLGRKVLPFAAGMGGPELFAAYMAGSMFFSGNNEAGEIPAFGPGSSAKLGVPTGLMKGSPNYDSFMAGLRGHLPNALGQVQTGAGMAGIANDPAYRAGLKRYEQTLTAPQLERVNRTLDSINQNFTQKPLKVTGKASVDVNLKDTNGKTITKKSVTLDLFPDFTHMGQTQRGKPKTQRGG